MKKLLLRIILFLLPVIPCLFLAEILIGEVPNNYSFKNEYILTKGAEIETLILGSSHTYFGINPKYLELNSFNLANVSQSIMYDKALICNYMQYLPNLKRVIIPISYFTLPKVPNTGEEEWRKYDYLHFMNCETNILSPFNVKYYSVLASKGIAKSFKANFKYFLLKKDQVNCSEFGFGENSTLSQQKDLVSSGDIAAKRHENNNSDFSYNKEILADIVETSKQNQVELYIITTPTLSYYYSHLSKDKLLLMNKTIETICAKNNVKYLNFLKDPRFEEKDFYDSDHLNSDGAVKFSKLLKEIITEK